MLFKGKQVQLAAIAALTMLFSANATLKPANAQAGVQLAQADKQDVKRSTTTRTTTVKRAPSHATQRKTVVKRSTTVRSNRYSTHNRYNNNSRIVVRSRPSSTVAFAVYGPRVVYRSYGSGWCRALHGGRHWAPRIGWHSGRHVGAVRCG
jgi:hypothetical protein